MKFETLPKKKYKFVESIDGWLTEPEINLLYTLAKKCTGKGTIVEIGTWKGKSTVCLAYGCKAGKKIKITTIDPHTGGVYERDLYREPIWTFEEFKNNIKKANLSDLIIDKVASSVEVAKSWKQPVELLWIDGSHLYEDIKKDFEMWLPYVVNGGIVAIHDTINIEGPRRAAIEEMYLSKNFKDLGIVDSITFATKVKKNSSKDRLRNRFILLINKFSAAIFRIPTPVIIRVVGKKFLSFIQ